MFIPLLFTVSNEKEWILLEVPIPDPPDLEGKLNLIEHVVKELYSRINLSSRFNHFTIGVYQPIFSDKQTADWIFKLLPHHPKRYCYLLYYVAYGHYTEYATYDQALPYPKPPM